MDGMNADFRELTKRQNEPQNGADYEGNEAGFTGKGGRALRLRGHYDHSTMLMAGDRF